MKGSFLFSFVDSSYKGIPPILDTSILFSESFLLPIPLSKQPI